MKVAHKKQIECRQAALPHLRPPGERVEIPYQGKTLAGILRKPAGVERAAGRGDGGRARFDQGGNRRLRSAVPGARHGDAGVRRARPGRGAIRLPDPRRLRSAGEGGARLYRHAARSRCRAHRHVGRQPRRLLRAARRRLRQAHQGLHRARRPVRLGRRLGRPAGTDARSVPRAQPLQDARRGAQERRDAVARGRGAATSPARFSS